MSCSLTDGRVKITLSLDNMEEEFLVGEPALHDGEPHLLQVTRDGDKLVVFIDDVPRLNDTLTISGDFYTQVMYLGGLPAASLPSSLAALSRKKRQLGTRNDQDDSTINNSINSGTLSTSGPSVEITGTGIVRTTDATFGVNEFSDVNFNEAASGDGSINFDFATTNEQIFPSAETDFGSSPAPPSEDYFQPSFASESFSPIDFPSSVASSSPSSFPSTSFVPSTPSGFGGNQNAGPVHFKGILQDIRIGNGTRTRLVQPFVLNVIDGENFELPGESINNTVLHNVMEGTVSDAACDSNPCQNGATCSVTWNDYHCECTFGFKGKDCHELEYCARHGCPEDSTCRNLLDGYECLADRTMNGINSSASFRASVTQPPAVVRLLSIAYRSQLGGVMLRAEHDLSSVEVALGQADDGSRILVTQVHNSQLVMTEFLSSLALNGEWHTLNITLDANTGIGAILDEVNLSPVQPQPVTVNVREMMFNGTIRLGSGQTLGSSYNLINEDYSSPEPLQSIPPPVPQFYRGCFGEVRIQGILLPSYSPEILSADTSANRYLLLVSEIFLNLLRLRH